MHGSLSYTFIYLLQLNFQLPFKTIRLQYTVYKNFMFSLELYDNLTHQDRRMVHILQLAKPTLEDKSLDYQERRNRHA